MSHIENIFICLGAPMIISILCLKGTKKGRMIFLFAGVTACFFSSYITTYLAQKNYLDNTVASIEIAPYVEELIKFIPLLYYLLVYTPNKSEVPERVLMTSVGFATFENVCYLIMNGSESFFHLGIRGFGTGAMHVICGTIVSAGVVWFWGNRWLQMAGIIGLLAVAITYHSIYNLLVAQTGMPAMIGYVSPVIVTAAVVLIAEIRLMKQRKISESSENYQDIT